MYVKIYKMESVKKALSIVETLNDKKKMNDEEYTELCSELKKLYNKVNYVMVKKITITTNTYWEADGYACECCHDEDRGLTSSTELDATTFTHEYKPNGEDCEETKLKQVCVRTRSDIIQLKLRVEEVKPCRPSISDDYIEERALKRIKEDGVIINGAIWIYIGDVE